MKTLLIFLSFGLLFSCKNETNSDISGSNENIESTEEMPAPVETTSDSSLVNQNYGTKYYFIGVGILEPARSRTTFVDGEPRTTIEFEHSFYTTDIQNYEGDVSEDLKYQWLDEAEKNIKNSHKINPMINEPRRTLCRELYKFDSYKEASLALQKIAKGQYEETTDYNTGEVSYKF